MKYDNFRAARRARIAFALERIGFEEIKAERHAQVADERGGFDSVVREIVNHEKGRT